MTTDEQPSRIHLPDEMPTPASIGAGRAPGLALVCIGWLLGLFVLLAGYRELLVTAGLSGVGLAAVVLLSVPFGVFLTIGASTWCLGVVAAGRRSVPEGLRWQSVSSVADLVVLTAIVFPIKNEDAAQVFANVAAIRESLREAGAEHLFDVYVVSNSDDPNCWVEEELTWHSLSGMFEGVYYWRRHREQGKKPANIAEFCERWGSRYEYMVVLDADSLMSADCLLTLVGLMECNPRSAIMQAPTNIVNGQTLFARLQQFTGWSEAKIPQWGERIWQGSEGCYFGHNAIIRVAPFMRHCGLPRLPGRPPFGGELLSHDFVESTLLSRAGWDVWILPELEGSYEDCSGTLEQYFRRVRRWSQGDIINLRVLIAPKLPLAGRILFMIYALRDISPPLLLLLSGLLVVLADSPPFAAAAVFIPLLILDSAFRKSWVGVPAMAFGFSVHARSANRDDLPVLRSICSRFVSQVLWLALAPTRLLICSVFAVEILSGRDAGWSAMPRTGYESTLSRVTRTFWPYALFGVTVTAALALTDSWALWWLSPVLLCWIFTIPVTLAFGSWRIGAVARRARILLTPEENSAPPIVTRSAQLAVTLRKKLPPQPWRAALTDDTAITVHRAFLAHGPPCTRQEREAAASAAEKYLTAGSTATGPELTDMEKLALLRAPDLVWRDPSPATLSIHFPTATPASMPVQQLIRKGNAS